MAEANPDLVSEVPVEDTIVTCMRIMYNMICVGTNKYMRIFKIKDVITLQPVREIKSYISLVEIAPERRKVFWVGDAPRHLKQFCYPEDKDGFLTEVRENRFSADITQIRANDQFYVVATKKKMYIFDYTNHKSKRELVAYHNQNGVISISKYVRNNPWFVFASDYGVIGVYNLLTEIRHKDIRAHITKVTALAQSDFEPIMVATASAKGTLVRLYDMAGLKLHEFRRGAMSDVDINSLSFTDNGHFLLCGTNSLTASIFKLVKDNKTPASRGLLAAAASYVQTNLMSGEPAFAWVTLKQILVKKASCSFYQQDHAINVMSISQNGFLEVHKLNTEDGGDCHFVTNQLLLYKKANLQVLSTNVEFTDLDWSDIEDLGDSDS